MSTSMGETAGPGTNAEGLDTISLLLEEIARLEAELRMRDEMAADDGVASAPVPGAHDVDEAGSRRVAELVAELDERDRMIELLWEQVAILEEAEAADRAEWEQLHGWLAELERRVEGQDDGPRDLADELALAHRETETLRAQYENERLSWDARRLQLEGEITSLRNQLDAAAGPASADEARAALERENRRLRHESHRLAAAAAHAAGADTLREQLRAARGELDEVRGALDRTADDLQRQRIEHEAELASLRSELARQRLSAHVEDLSVNQRMRALREHLSEIHRLEEQERRNRRLTARISRLWSRTGPRS